MGLWRINIRVSNIRTPFGEPFDTSNHWVKTLQEYDQGITDFKETTLYDFHQKFKPESIFDVIDDPLNEYNNYSETYPLGIYPWSRWVQPLAKSRWFKGRHCGPSAIETIENEYDAFIALYEVTLNELWINKANELAAYTFENFFDAEKNMFYFTSKEDEKLVARNFEYRDNVIPASNSIMAKNLLILSHHFDNKKYLTTASKMLHNVQPEIESYPSGFSNWLDLMSNFQDNFYEVVVVGKDASKKIAKLNARYLPNILVAGSTSESKKPLLNYRYIDGETLIYVCVNNSCKLPVPDVSEALNFIK